MKRIALASACGLLFGLGLALSGMVQPARVLGFLDVAGRWDPTLALVMASALLVATPLFALAARRGRSLDGVALPPSSPSRIDGRLLAGAALFGAGWGLAGYCPGPALANVAAGSADAAWWALAMLAGSGTAKWLDRERGEN